MKIILLLIFWGAQILAHVTFKLGSEYKSRWWLCFIIGNTIGVASIGILMKLYTAMPPNLALGLALGGGFLCAQIAIAIFFKTNISVLQYLGACAIALGMAFFAFGSKKI